MNLHFSSYLGLCIAFAFASKCFAQPDRRTHSDRTIIVRWEDARTASEARAEPTPLMDAISARVIWVSRVVPGLSTVEVPSGDAELAVDLLSFERGVVDASLDGAMYSGAVPNDPHWNSTSPIQFQQYTAFKQCLQKAWNIQTSSNVMIAVLDTGVDYTFSDTLPNLRTNPGEINDGNDNDGNGVIDDIYGAEFLPPGDIFETSPPAEPHSDPLDLVYHGTFVGSVLGAR